jgi:hypothetical protein
MHRTIPYPCIYVGTVCYSATHVYVRVRLCGYGHITAHIHRLVFRQNYPVTTQKYTQEKYITSEKQFISGVYFQPGFP